MRLSSALLLLGSLHAAAAIAIMGVDFGSEFIKVSVVKPGMPFQVVANFQSKRKTPSLLSFYAGERLFGADAEALLGRKPHLVATAPQELLGRNVSHPLVDTYLHGSFLGSAVEANARGGLDFVFPEATSSQRFSAEELAAMLLAHARDFASHVAGQRIHDAVITVPSFASQSERLALHTAAELAGVKVLALVDENTAAGIHYGIDRVFENATHHMLLYNMGAESTQVTLFAYDAYTYTERGLGGRNKTVGQAHVLAKAWDMGLGGHAFDRALLAHVADAFNADPAKAKSLPASARGDIRNVPSAMAKLRKGVVRTKEVLSANEEYGLVVESVVGETDLRAPLSRAALERIAAAAGLNARITAVLDSCLAQANLTVADLATVEIVGGGVRMPLVQRVLREHFAAKLAAAAGEAAPAAAAVPTDKFGAPVGASPDSPSLLGQHLNGDEAMALGAAFLAANRSASFRVRKVGMVDAHPFGIGVRVVGLTPTPVTEAAVTVEGDAAAPTPKPWSKRSSLFRPYNPLESTKRISFAVTHDLRATLFYEAAAAETGAPALPAGVGRFLGAYNISGIATLVEEQSRREAERLASLRELGIELPEAAAAHSAGAEEAAAATAAPAAASASLTPKVQLAFELDHSGVARLVRAEAVFEVTEKEVVKPSAKPDAIEADASPSASPAADAAATTSPSPAEAEASASATPSPSPAAPVYRAVRKTLRFALTVADDSAAPGLLPVQPMGAEARAEAVKVLATLAAADEARHARESAKNSVEAYIYATREKLDAAAEGVAAASTEAQVEALRESLMAAEEWLYDDGAAADTATYKSRLQAMRALGEPIFARVEEAAGRPKLLSDAKAFVEASRTLMASWPTTHPQISVEEVADAAVAVADLEGWLARTEAEQEGLAGHEDPVLTRAGVLGRMKPVTDLLTRLSKKPKPTPTPAPSLSPSPAGTSKRRQDKSAKGGKASKATAAPAAAEDEEAAAEPAAEKESAFEAGAGDDAEPTATAAPEADAAVEADASAPASEPRVGEEEGEADSQFAESQEAPKDEL